MKMLGKKLCLVAVVILTSACGAPDKSANDGPTPVTEKAFFGSQCPYGDFSDPVPGDLELWSCPTGLKQVALKQSLQPLIFEADCKKKVISARSFDHQSDTSWEMLPDGSFSFTIDGGRVDFVDDGTGKACGTGLSATVTGQVDCSHDRDRVLIAVDTIWSLKKDLSGAPALDGDRACQLPTSCYLHSSAKVHQCQ